VALCGAGLSSYFDVELFFADGALAHNFYHCGTYSCCGCLMTFGIGTFSPTSRLRSKSAARSASLRVMPPSNSLMAAISSQRSIISFSVMAGLFD
jgi:hypothetical protein